MTWFIRSASRLLACLFGRVEVRPHHFPRALRIFKAILEENDLNPDYLPEPAYDALMTEVFERARIRDANEVLRWKHLLSEIILIYLRFIVFFNLILLTIAHSKSYLN